MGNGDSPLYGAKEQFSLPLRYQRRGGGREERGKGRGKKTPTGVEPVGGFLLF